MGVNRQERREQHPSGSCLTLWNRQDIRNELWAQRMAAVGRRRQAGATRPARPVVVSQDLDYAEQVVSLGADRRMSEIWTNPRSEKWDGVLEAWVALVQENLADLPLTFFTGTYRDDYGVSHGLMLPRNVQADFRRALKEADLADARFVNAVEPHRLRSMLHCHALIEATEAEAALLKTAWDSRGWSSAPRCSDGGVAYCCKYALKSASADSFDWRW